MTIKKTREELAIYLGKIPASEMCFTEEHETIPATKRIIESMSDSSCGYRYVCDECYNKHDKKPHIKYKCDWCENISDIMLEVTDSEKGSTGLVSIICISCMQNYVKLMT